ncbi:MAG: UvrD-helicase domain-containing protein [Clostridia bacterium]|nr:UvrD-helicase domain-containing protein [Clostridia bacterium]
MDFSKDQRLAIETRDRTILVSAAAGSGKTTTLTERIIQSLLEDNSKVSLQNMLIVTYTRISAADLVRKIGKALTNALLEIESGAASAPSDGKGESPEDKKKRLENELYLLPAARIQTIDSFCADIVRANTKDIGIPPNFRIADKAEIRMLSEEVLESVISAAYEGELRGEGILPLEFDRLASSLTSAKKAGDLADVLLSLYDKCKTTVDGVGIFKKYANDYLQNGDFEVEDTKYGRDAIKHAGEVFEYIEAAFFALSDALALGDEDEVKESNFYALMASFVAGLPRNSYNAIRRAIFEPEYPTRALTGSIPKANLTPLINSFRNREKNLKAKIETLYKTHFSYTTEMWRELYGKMHASVSLLARTLEIFDKAYMREKVRRNMFEYSDIEKYAYDILYTEDGERSDFAESYAASLDAVYIDEYQDVNELQDAVFRAVSKKDNRFMVGDIKQAIYVFRSAKPEIFSSLKRALPLLDKKPDPAGNSIFMSENYRCDRGIVDFVNSIFDKMFSVVRESIEFLPEDSLGFAKKYGEDGKGPEPRYRRPEVCIVEGTRDERGKPMSLEWEYVADRIDDLIKNGRLNSPRKDENGNLDYSVHPEDIAILLRTWTNMPSIVSALEKRGIAVEHGIDRDFFMNADVRLVICLLSAIDNPSKDVYLAGLMCSPLFGFAADELLRYRKGERGFVDKNRPESLYRSVKGYSLAHPEDEKLSSFLNTLTHYRALSESLNVYTLISRLYDETGVLALASARGEGYRLITLYNLARKFESSSYKGLYSFITYVNNIMTVGQDIEEKGSSEGTGAVKIFTAHGSKGLEFPIVFFADATHELDCLDTRPAILHSEGYGVGYALRDESSVALVENPVKHIIKDRMIAKFYEEELRILYVALTRASEQLIVVGRLAADDTFEKLMTRVEVAKRTLTPYGITNLSTYIDIILATAPKAELKLIPAPTEQIVIDPSGEICEPTEREDEEPADTAPEADGELYRRLSERFSYTYPYEAETRLPEKMSVSNLYPRLLDDLEEMTLTEARSSDKARMPEFIAGKGERGGAEEGIATHMMLQFADLEALKREGAEAELSRLVEKRFLSAERAALVRLSEIERFITSPLIDEMLSARKIYRELRFNARTDAALIAEDEARRTALDGKTMLVQGVIDCLIVDKEEEIHLIDYKTDRLTREELSDRAAATERLTREHATQLSYYAKAIEKMFGKRPKTVRIYSLHLGDSVDIPTLF